MILSKSQKAAKTNVLKKLNSGEYQMSPNPCVCKKERTLKIYNKDRYNMPLNSVLCENCGLVRSTPYFTDDTLSKFYEFDYRALYSTKDICDEDFFNEEVAFGKNILSWIKRTEILKNINSVKVYEIGCGAGGILKAFADEGASVFGCDHNEDYLNFGKKKGVTHLELGDTSSLLKFGEADLVILNHVLEHFRNPKKELENISKLIKNNGLLYVAVPGIFSIKENYGNLKNYFQNAHAFHYTLKTLSSLMHDCGFSIVEGDESIKSLFVKKKNSQAPQPESVQKIYCYMKNVRRFGLIYSLPIIDYSGQTIKWLQNYPAIYSVARKIYRKVKKHE
jgi:2-polyprenyl-3-methyl-5-hydroxy-6-metoxy-1,4-benzoquinol methylase